MSIDFSITFLVPYKGAIILTEGNKWHTEGFEIEAELLSRGYDVHLIQIQKEGKIKFKDETIWDDSNLSNIFLIIFSTTNQSRGRTPVCGCSFIQ